MLEFQNIKVFFFSFLSAKWYPYSSIRYSKALTDRTFSSKSKTKFSVSRIHQLSLSSSLIIIIIARFYSLTNVAMLLLRSDSNSYSLLVGSACLRKQTDVRHTAAWKWLDLSQGPPDTKQPLYHLCYLAFDKDGLISKKVGSTGCCTMDNP